MWIFDQSGQLTYPGGAVAAACYSGNGEGKNNPAMQDVPCVGPIPQGMYTIVGPPFDDPKLGIYVMHLIPDATNEMFGRSGFDLHGDSLEHPGQASEGCIVAPHNVRVDVWTSCDRRLQVV